MCKNTLRVIVLLLQHLQGVTLTVIVFSPQVSHGVHDPEEFPFLEEVHILRRLKVSDHDNHHHHQRHNPYNPQATLYAVVNWVEAKSASHVQAWNVSRRRCHPASAFNISK